MPSLAAAGPESIRLVFIGFSMMTLSAFAGPTRFGQQVAATPARHEPEEGLGQGDGGDAGADRAVVARQRDLDAATHGRAVDERERRDGQVHDRRERGVAGPGDLEGLVAAAHGGDAGQVGADGEDERLAGDADGLDLAGLGALAEGVDDGLEAGDALGAERVGPGVVEAVVERDERQGAGVTGEGDVLDEGAGDDLAAGGCAGEPRWCVVVVGRSCQASCP